MLFQLPSSIQALILDMDGVLYRQNETIGSLPVIFDRIRQLGLQVMFATNSTTLTAEQYVPRLANMGVSTEAWQFITSPAATAHALSKRWPRGGPVHLIGEIGLHQPMQEKGFYHAEQDVLAVVAGLDKHFTYEKLVKGVRLILQGVPFIGTNPDLLFPTPDGPSIGTGGMLAILETCSGVKPEIIGKPYPAMMHMALDELHMTPDQALVVGDRLDTDIAAGQAAGCFTALVLSGIATRQEAEQWQPRPDLIAQDLASLLGI